MIPPGVRLALNAKGPAVMSGPFPFVWNQLKAVNGKKRQLQKLAFTPTKYRY